jgi:hypothetical protein
MRRNKIQGDSAPLIRTFNRASFASRASASFFLRSASAIAFASASFIAFVFGILAKVALSISKSSFPFFFVFAAFLTSDVDASSSAFNASFSAALRSFSASFSSFIFALLLSFAPTLHSAASLFSFSAFVFSHENQHTSKNFKFDDNLLSRLELT